MLALLTASLHLLHDLLHTSEINEQHKNDFILFFSSVEADSQIQ